MGMQRVPIHQTFYEARFIGSCGYIPAMQKYGVSGDSAISAFVIALFWYGSIQSWSRAYSKHANGRGRKH